MSLQLTGQRTDKLQRSMPGGEASFPSTPRSTSKEGLVLSLTRLVKTDDPRNMASTLEARVSQTLLAGQHSVEWLLEDHLAPARPWASPQSPPGS